MIKRIWRGWTSVDNADEYEQLLNTTIVPGITAHVSQAIVEPRSCENATQGRRRSSSSRSWRSTTGTPSGSSPAAMGMAAWFPRGPEHYCRVSMSTPLTSMSPATIRPPISIEARSDRRPETPRWRSLSPPARCGRQAA